MLSLTGNVELFNMSEPLTDHSVTCYKIVDTCLFCYLVLRYYACDISLVAIIFW